MGLSVRDLIDENMRAAGVDRRAVLGASIPVYTTRGRRLGVYEFRLGSSSVSSLASAIASAEGFNTPGSIPQRANNPGDLELGDVGYGMIAAAGGNKITIFPDVATGQAALESQIQKIISGTSTAGYSPDMSIAQVGQIYSGGSPTWAATVASALGVSVNDSFAAQAGADGGSLLADPLASAGGFLADPAGAISDAWASETGQAAPAWAPWAVLGVGILVVYNFLG